MMTKRSNIFASLRFLMIFYIVQGHFIQVATDNAFWLAIFKQHNLVVGCFFLLSGFLLALGQNKESTPHLKWPFFKKRVMRIYPVYVVVLLIFSPMFIAVDIHYGTDLLLEIKRAVIVLTLVQAWHPDWGLLWNSPTWFLSSLVFCYACFPFLIEKLKRFDKEAIVKTASMVFFVLLTIKVLYSAKNGFFFLEGLLTSSSIPYFELIRFFPPINLLEFVLGILTGLLFNQADRESCFLKEYFPIGALLVMALLMLARVYLPLNDMLTRTLIFTPIFLAFLYFVNFSQGKYLGLFESRLWVFLGNISFSLYCVHGALGQLCYKKAVVAMLGLPHIPYFLYLGALFVMASALYYVVEQKVAQWK